MHNDQNVLTSSHVFLVSYKSFSTTPSEKSDVILLLYFEEVTFKLKEFQHSLSRPKKEKRHFGIAACMDTWQLGIHCIAFISLNMTFLALKESSHKWWRLMITNYSDIHACYFFTNLSSLLFKHWREDTFSFIPKVISVYPFLKAVIYPFIDFHLSHGPLRPHYL